MDATFPAPAYRLSTPPFGPGTRSRADRETHRGAREATSLGRPASEPERAGASLRLAAVSKSYGRQRVVSDLDLVVEPGELVAVVGRSGCGKSTLLRLALGLETPDAGRIEIGGKEPNEAGGPTARLVFQEARLLPWAGVEENVALGVPHDIPAAERRRLAQETLAAVGLRGREREYPSVLSGGQRQRVSLARALVSRPRFLALDEPLGALDALTRIEMQALLESVWRSQGFTGLLVTHDVSEAVTLADRVLVMEEGRFAYEERIDLPRPRRHGDAQAAAIERRVLDRLLARSAQPSGDPLRHAECG